MISSVYSPGCYLKLTILAKKYIVSVERSPQVTFLWETANLNNTILQRETSLYSLSSLEQTRLFLVPLYIGHSYLTREGYLTIRTFEVTHSSGIYAMRGGGCYGGITHTWISKICGLQVVLRPQLKLSTLTWKDSWIPQFWRFFTSFKIFSSQFLAKICTPEINKSYRF